MSNYEQNGRSPAEHTAPPTDPRLTGVKAPPQTADLQKRCRDYVWGICSSKECRYRHEFDFEFMRKILRFCHDYQNRTGCTRHDCTYLHCGRDEENQFLNNGVIPRVLLERYAAMPGSSDRPEPAPHNKMHVYHDYVARPPPPPPAAAQLVAGPSTRPSSDTVVPIAAAPMGIKVSVSTLMPHAPAPLPSILRPPPPPPPPPPTVALTPAPVSQPIYTVTPPMQHTVIPMYPMAPASQMMQPQQMSPSYSLPAIYNPSIPPPPIPVAIQPVTQKRPAILEPEAGPSSKLAKHDDYPEATCDSCVDFSFRAELCVQEAEKIQRGEEARRADYDARVDEYEKGRVLLRSKLTPHMFQAADEFIDSPVGSAADIFAGTSPTYSAPSVSKQPIFQLMEFIVNKVHADTETPSLDALARRTFTQADFSRLSRLHDHQGLEALLERILTSSERRELEPLARPLELPSPALARYAAPPAYAPAITRDPPTDPLYAYQPQVPQPPPRPAPYNYPSSSSSMQYGAAAPAQPPAGSAPAATSSAAYQQYLSRMPPNHNPYYRPFQ